MKVRDDVLKSLEEARTEKIIGNSLEAKVTIEANDEEVKEVLSNIKDIHQLLIVLEAVINESHPDAKEYKYMMIVINILQKVINLFLYTLTRKIYKLIYQEPK